MRLAIQDQVRDFMQLGGQDCPERPTRPSTALAMFRYGLIQEELDELRHALDDNSNLVEAADALADLLYVVLGTGVALGINLGPIFDIVHEANMAKYPMCCGQSWCDIVNCGNPESHDSHPTVLRRPDGKVQKPVGWTSPEPAIKAELARQFSTISSGRR